MDAEKKRKLRQLGGRVSTVAEFLNLIEAARAIDQLRLEVTAAVRKPRTPRA